MSNGKIKAVVSYDLQINVRTSQGFDLLEVQDKKYFSWLKNAYTKTSEAITLKEIETRLNDYKKAQRKDLSECILKGLYKNGTSGVHNVKTAPFLFFDIDVEDNKDKKENVHLFDPRNNTAVFEYLKKVSVLVWRSNSGTGIAGILYTPEIVEFTNDSTSEHKKVGGAITDYLSNLIAENTDVGKVTFDQAQSKFRQVRFLAEQQEPRQLNQNALAFHYDLKRIEKRTPQDVPIYHNENYTPSYGSIFEQFNNNNSILDIALNNGFTIVGSRSKNKIRVKHSLTTSTSSGEIVQSENIYLNNSQSFSNRTNFNPSSLICYLQFNNDWGTFAKYLIEQGYKNETLPQREVKALKVSLKQELDQIADDDQVSKIIFEHCYNLQTAPDEVKRQFIKDSCPRPELLKYFYEYLKFTDYLISYKHTIVIQNYVSEAITNILECADSYGRIIVKAETGTGKTYAVINEIHKHRPEARILIVAPLTMIVEQQAKINTKGVYLTGKSVFDDRIKVLVNNLCFMTYEQGARFLAYDENTEVFDYVIIDEVHNLITANGYKHDVILNLTESFGGRKLIGLTATPLQVFNKLGFELIEVKAKKQTPTDVEIRYSNLDPYKIAINHLLNVKGKTIVRLNSRKSLINIKSYLTQQTKKYKPSEVVIFNSDKDIKNGKDFQFVADQEQFEDSVKVILTTSIIDEGVNVKQLGFTDVVFIETSYTPRPEAVKQFFARFRLPDPNRKNYLYLRTRKDQTPTNYKPFRDFDNVKNELINLKNGEVFTSSSTGIAGNYDKFIIDNTSKINLYYLAYYITGNLFAYLNTDQYLTYLEANYNLKLSINKMYEVTATAKEPSREELKKSLAKIWLDHKATVFNTLYHHTGKRRLKQFLTLQQEVINETAKTIVLNYQKDFEDLATNYFKLLNLGVKKPDEVLTKLDDTNFYTLSSQNDLKKAFTVLKYTKTIDNPTPTDLERINKLDGFIQECKTLGTITDNVKNKLLRKYKLYFDKQIRKNEVLEALFNHYGLSFKYNHKKKEISIKNKPEKGITKIPIL